jgi:lipooligosaccharide transport system permease protein
MTATTALRVTPGLLAGTRAPAIVERNLIVYRHSWVLLISGLLEPLFYLLALGVGVGKLVGDITGPDGQPISYAAFVAPAMLASSIMNGAIIDTTFNVFFKLKYAKVYDAVLATPVSPLDITLGEISWSLGRGLLYCSAFLAFMTVTGLVSSWWALLVVPVAALAGFSFAAVGMACTTFMRTWQDFEWVTLATVPMFLLSATFYPITTYPPTLQTVVRWTPLYQVVDLMRSLTTGALHPGLVWNVLYLLAIGALGLTIARARLGRLLLR